MTPTRLKLAKPPRRPSIAMLRKAIRMYSSPYVSREQNKRNRRKWLASVDWLGDRWILAGRREVTWGAKQRRVD
jgi:hypothetical protein